MSTLWPGEKRGWTKEKMDVIASVKTETPGLAYIYPVIDDSLFRIYISFSEYRLHLDDVDLI